MRRAPGRHDDAITIELRPALGIIGELRFQLAAPRQRHRLRLQLSRPEVIIRLRDPASEAVAVSRCPRPPMSIIGQLRSLGHPLHTRIITLDPRQPPACVHPLPHPAQ